MSRLAAAEDGGAVGALCEVLPHACTAAPTWDAAQAKTRSNEFRPVQLLSRTHFAVRAHGQPQAAEIFNPYMPPLQARRKPRTVSLGMRPHKYRGEDTRMQQGSSTFSTAKVLFAEQFSKSAELPASCW